MNELMRNEKSQRLAIQKLSLCVLLSALIMLCCDNEVPTIAKTFLVEEKKFETKDPTIGATPLSSVFHITLPHFLNFY